MNMLQTIFLENIFLALVEEEKVGEKGQQQPRDDADTSDDPNNQLKEKKQKPR